MFQTVCLAAQIMLAALLASFSAQLVAVSKCQAAAGNHYEQVFCELSSSRYNYELPSLQEFRQNPAKIQYLLLKRPAKREGVTLNKPAASSQAKELRSKTTVARAAALTQKPVARLNRPGPAAFDQGECRYTARKIDCGDRQFRLQTNRRNSELADAALGDTNVLRLPKKRANQPVEAWLAEAYKEYLAALLSIGLAGSSSTYSAFAHTYYELENSGTDFATRIQESFNLLKKDKRSLAASKRYPKSAPLSADCEWLASTMIACNSAGKNWVYTSD